MKKLIAVLIACLIWVGPAYAHSDIDNLPPAVAIMSYRHILYMNPDDLATRNKLAMAYVRTNELQQASNELAFILKKDPNNFDALDAYGVVLVRAGKHKDALKYFRKAATINGKDVMVYVHLSVAYEKLRQRDKAQASMKKARSLASKDELKKVEAERRFLYGR